MNGIHYSWMEVDYQVTCNDQKYLEKCQTWNRVKLCHGNKHGWNKATLNQIKSLWLKLNWTGMNRMLILPLKWLQTSPLGWHNSARSQRWSVKRTNTHIQLLFSGFRRSVRNRQARRVIKRVIQNHCVINPANTTQTKTEQDQTLFIIQPFWSMTVNHPNLKTEAVYSWCSEAFWPTLNTGV